MKKLVLLIAAACLLIAIVATAAYADEVWGTTGNDWGPIDEHKNWPLPMASDCNGETGQGNIPRFTTGADTIHGRSGCDYLRGGQGSDRLEGDGGMDVPYGGFGNDALIGNSGHDHAFGEEGNDTINVKDGNDEPGAHEEVHGGSGWDQCYIESDPDGVEFSDCEKLNGATPIIKGAGGEWNDYSQGYVDTSDNNDQFRQNVNEYLNNHGG